MVHLLVRGAGFGVGPPGLQPDRRVYEVELMRAHVGGDSLAVAHRVAARQVAMEWPAMVGEALLLAGLANGYPGS